MLKKKIHTIKKVKKVAPNKNSLEHITNIKSNILRQTFLLMAEKGITNVSMREIASACKVSKPVLYYYYKDRDDLCFNLISKYLQTFNASLKERIKKGDTFPKLLHFSLQENTTNLKDNKKVRFFLYMVNYWASSTKLVKKFAPLRNDIFDCLNKILEKEVKKGNIPSKNKEIAYHLILGGFDYIILHADDKAFKFPKNFAKDYTNVILKAIDYKEKK